MFIKNINPTLEIVENGSTIALLGWRLEKGKVTPITEPSIKADEWVYRDTAASQEWGPDGHGMFIKDGADLGVMMNANPNSGGEGYFEHYAITGWHLSQRELYPVLREEDSLDKMSEKPEDQSLPYGELRSPYCYFKFDHDDMFWTHLGKEMRGEDHGVIYLQELEARVRFELDAVVSDWEDEQEQMEHGEAATTE